MAINVKKLSRSYTHKLFKIFDHDETKRIFKKMDVNVIKQAKKFLKENFKKIEWDAGKAGTLYSEDEHKDVYIRLCAQGYGLMDVETISFRTVRNGIYQDGFMITKKEDRKLFDMIIARNNVLTENKIPSTLDVLNELVKKEKEWS